MIPFIARADTEHPENMPKKPERNLPNGFSGGDLVLSIHDPLIEKKQPNGLSNGKYTKAPNAMDHGSLVTPLGPYELIDRLGFALPEEGLGKQGLVDILRTILKYSVNTWHQGFMHKLYATTNPIGVVSELILAVLNTNVS